jgi:hypothetical protein
MSDRFVPIADDFWNIRGSFKLGGVVDIGTQASLVRRASGSFVLLDAYTLSGAVQEQVFALTNGGRAIEAVLHLHPFHTIHVKKIAEQLPHVVHYGSTRHFEKAPGVNWAPHTIDAEATAEHFAADFELSIPAGVPFIAKDERLHFSSVLAFHKSSRTLHVDDTLTWSTLPLIGGLVFHPTLAKVLEKRPGAAAEFRAWALWLVDRCASVDHLVTAHMRALPPNPKTAPVLHERVRTALSKVESVLQKHEKRWG